MIMSGCRDVTPKAKEAGAVAVVRKPIDPQIFVRLVEHFSPSRH